MIGSPPCCRQPIPHSFLCIYWAPTVCTALFKVDIGLQGIGIAWVKAWCWSAPVFERVSLTKGLVILVNTGAGELQLQWSKQPSGSWVSQRSLLLVIYANRRLTTKPLLLGSQPRCRYCWGKLWGADHSNSAENDDSNMQWVLSRCRHCSEFHSSVLSVFTPLIVIVSFSIWESEGITR